MEEQLTIGQKLRRQSQPSRHEQLDGSLSILSSSRKRLQLGSVVVKNGGDEFGGGRRSGGGEVETDSNEFSREGGRSVEIWKGEKRISLAPVERKG